MAITGIVMMAYADGFHGDSITGVAYAVGSASTSALYKVGHGRLVASSSVATRTHVAMIVHAPARAAQNKIDLATRPLLSLPA